MIQPDSKIFSSCNCVPEPIREQFKNKIVEATQGKTHVTMLEIGAGHLRGLFLNSQALLKQGKSVHAIAIDPCLRNYEFGGSENFSDFIDIYVGKYEAPDDGKAAIFFPSIDPPVRMIEMNYINPKRTIYWKVCQDDKSLFECIELIFHCVRYKLWNKTPQGKIVVDDDNRYFVNLLYLLFIPRSAIYNVEMGYFDHVMQIQRSINKEYNHKFTLTTFTTTFSYYLATLPCVEEVMSERKYFNELLNAFRLQYPITIPSDWTDDMIFAACLSDQKNYNKVALDSALPALDLVVSIDLDAACTKETTYEMRTYSVVPEPVKVTIIRDVCDDSLEKQFFGSVIEGHRNLAKTHPSIISCQKRVKEFEGNVFNHKMAVAPRTQPLSRFWHVDEALRRIASQKTAANLARAANKS